MAKRIEGRCSFCGKSQDQVRRLVAGPGAVFICDECVRLCSAIISEPPPSPPAMGKPRWRKLIGGIGPTL